jgi:hypothetical protein
MLTLRRDHLDLKLAQLGHHLKRRTARQWIESARNRSKRTLFDQILRRSYRQLAKRHRADLPSLPAAARPILSDVETEGVHIASAGSLNLPFTDEIIQSATSLLPGLTQSPATLPGGFRVFADHACLNTFPRLFLWGLNDTVLDLVENYLGVPVGYHSVDVIRSINNGLSHGPRMWHIDGEDHRTFRIIIYLNDVDRDSGPFEYIPRPISDAARRALKYSQEYVPESIMSNFVDVDHWKACTGQRGTVIFADPANVFHRGKVPKNQERFAIFYSYHSAKPMYPCYLPPGFSPEFLASMEGQLSERQRACVFWPN